MKTKPNHNAKFVISPSDQNSREALIADYLKNISDVPRRVFEILYSTSDTTNAIYAILSILGQANHVSRVYIFEDTEDHKYCCNTFEWCAEGISPEIENLRHLSYDIDLGSSYLEKFDENGIFFCPDISTLPQVQYRMLAKQGVVAMLQSAIVERGEFKGYIGFDECTQTMHWSEEQKQCLLFVSKIIGTFLCKMRREEALQKSNLELQNSLAQLESEHQKLWVSEQRFQLIMKRTSVSVWDYDVENKTIVQTEFSQGKHGFQKNISNIPESLIQCGYVHPDSVDDFRQMYQKLADGVLYVEGTFRVQTLNRTDWWYEKVQYFNLLNENGKPYRAIAISSDITKTKAEGEKLRTIIDSVPGGIGIFEIADEQFRLLYLNNGFYHLVGENREKRQIYAGCDFWKAIHPEDLPHVKAVTKALLKGENTIDFKYRVKREDNQYVWLRVIGNKLIDESGKVLVYCSFINVNNTMKTLLELKKNKTLLDISMQNSKTSTWEFDVKKHCAILTEGAQIQHGLGKIVENMPQSMIENGYVHPDSAKEYRRLFSGEFPDRKPIQYDIQVQTPDRKGYWWERYILAPIYDGNGELTTVFGTSMDVTEQKKMLEFYCKQVYDLEHLNSANLIAKGRYNLNQNQVEYFHRETEDAVSENDILSYDQGMEKTAELFAMESQRRKFLSLFNREKLIREFKENHTEVSLEYKRKANDGSTLWCFTQGKLYADPSNGDIICFVCGYDITKQKTTQEMMDAVVRLDYDYMALLDCNTKHYTVYANRDPATSSLPPFYSSDYESDVKLFAQQHMAPGNVDRSIHDMSIKNIRKQLENQDCYTIYFVLKEADGKEARKMLQCSYLDKNKERVLITRVDVTDIYQREQEKIKELQVAKTAAEKAKAEAEEANRVKTQFFSRMSHDLRTPLNAVIGLTQLAKDELSDRNAIAKYINSIHSSGQFLLGLVNEGLDLEKITANKMVLHPQNYTYQAFENTVCTIVTPLCAQKNISFVFGRNNTPYTIFVDHVRFEQIFINLLSNAVKFTPKGGKIELLITNNRYHESILSCDILVRDNGIGMSESFQQKMFEPFSQESSEIMPQLQGTGLGLSIVKSLVALMGGTISVKSEQGKGTEFTVHLDLPVVEDSHLAVVAEKDTNQDLLRGKRVLLVEDHPLNTQIAQKLLEKCAMTVICAENGQKGLELFAASEIGAFDVILMDIHMPVMDGLTAAHKIRALARQDARTIPILAMSANAFETDKQKSMKAGMNEHLSKPIDPEMLYHVLAKYMSQTTVRDLENEW